MAAARPRDDIRRLADFSPGSDYVPSTGYVKAIRTMGDVFDYLSNVRDMGAGMLVVDINLPEKYTREYISNVFRENKHYRRMSARAGELGHGIDSMTHLGGDGCYFAMLHGGGDLEDKYKLVVLSYDEQSSERFRDVINLAVNTRIAERRDGSWVNLNVDLRKIIYDKRHKVYENAIQRGVDNRRILCASILRGLNIDVPVDKVRLDNGSSEPAVITQYLSGRDYPCTFLEEGTEEDGVTKVVRLYSRAFSSLDLLLGAPWCLGYALGFHCYERTNKVTLEDVSMPLGMPMGSFPPMGEIVPHDRIRDSMRSHITQDLTENIQSKITWSTNLDVMMVATPGSEAEIVRSVNDLEDSYGIRTVRCKVWRTIAMCMSCPTIYNIPLDVLLKYTIGPSVTIHYERFIEITTMWTAIRDHYETRRKIPTIEELPPMSKFFADHGGHTQDGKYVSVAKIHLDKLLTQFKMIQSVAPPPPSSQPQLRSPPPDYRERQAPGPSNGSASNGVVIPPYNSETRVSRRRPHKQASKGTRKAMSESDSDIHCSGDDRLKTMQRRNG